MVRMKRCEFNIGEPERVTPSGRIVRDDFLECGKPATKLVRHLDEEYACCEHHLAKMLADCDQAEEVES